LPATNSIVINHTAGGKCILKISARIDSDASLTENTGMNLEVLGNLRKQKKKLSQKMISTPVTFLSVLLTLTLRYATIVDILL